MQSNPIVPRAPIQFIRIPDAVLLDLRLSPVQLRIYAVIARRTGRETASAFPSYATIARDANISRAAAIKAVAALVSFGYLSKQLQESGQSDLTSNLYTITGEGSEIFGPRGPKIPTDDAPALQIVHHGSADRTPQVVQKPHHRSSDRRPQVVQELDHGGAPVAPKPDSKNQRQKNKTQENHKTHAQ